MTDIAPVSQSSLIGAVSANEARARKAEQVETADVALTRDVDAVEISPLARFVALARENPVREDLIERIAQETIDIADAPVATTDKGGIDSAAVQKQRLQVDTRRWLLSKLAPKRYGEKLELSGDPAAPLVSRIERAIVGVKNTSDPDA